MHFVKRPGTTPSRSWDDGFLATDCKASSRPLDYYTVSFGFGLSSKLAVYLWFCQFYGPLNPNSAHCDVHIDGTAIAYGHDDIKNLGHTMSDFMNVWAMTWLAKTETNVSCILMRNSHEQL
jgi:hypothetical protein